MRLHSAKHGARVQPGRRRLFTVNPIKQLAGLLRYVAELLLHVAELLLVAGCVLIVVAVSWWSTPIAILVAGVLCMMLAWLVALGSSRGS